MVSGTIGAVTGRLRAAAGALALGLLLGSGVVPWPAAGLGGDADQLVSVPARVAFAGEDMCDGDPIFTIGNERLNVVVSVPVRALKYISAANPVVVTLHAPAGVTSSQIGYTGAFAEKAVIRYTQQAHSNANHYNVTVKTVAPDPNGTGTYPVYVTTASRFQSVTTAGASGRVVANAVRVPKS